MNIYENKTILKIYPMQRTLKLLSRILKILFSKTIDFKYKESHSNNIVKQNTDECPLNDQGIFYVSKKV